MSELTPLDTLGRDLDAALRRELPVVRRRRRIAAVAGALALAFAVPAAGTVTDWAGLAGGETALPTQVADGLRLPLAGGTDARGPWRLDVYRATLQGAGGRVGMCVFVTRSLGGTGRCLAPDAPGELVDPGRDPQVAIAAGVVRGRVARVEVTLARYDGKHRRVVAVGPSPAPADALQGRGLPTDLRPFAVVPPPGSVVLGVRALDATDRTLEIAARPAAPAPKVRARPSPIPAPAPRP